MDVATAASQMTEWFKIRVTGMVVRVTYQRFGHADVRTNNRTYNPAWSFETAQRHKTDMRTGAYILAVGRVVEATSVRGIFP